MTFVRSGAEVGRSFGYHPSVADLPLLLESFRFSRLLVVGSQVEDVVALVGGIRIAAEADVPEGLYWFGPLREPIAMMVVGGGSTTDGVAADPDDLDDGAPLFTAHDWVEHLWENGTTLPEPGFEVGDPVITRRDGKDCEVYGRKAVGGRWRYAVRLDGRPQNVFETALERAPASGNPIDWLREEPSPIDRFGATLTRGKLAASLTDTVFSFRATRTVFRPYQFKPVLRLLHTGATRILVADEVGLGKTIEAGLIWTELEARRSADRVLVIAPSSLVGKWQDEMVERFDRELTLLDAPGLDRFLQQHREGRLPKRFAYVTSIERLRGWGGLEELDDVPPQLDLIVVDEAHQMRNPGTKNHDLGVRLGDWADARVFLTATPVNLGNHDLASMLELLAPEDFDDPHVLGLRLEPNAVLHRVEKMLLDRTATGADRVAALDELKTMTFGAALMSRPDCRALRDLVAGDGLSAADVVEARRLLSEMNALASVITRTRKAEIDENKALRVPNRVTVSFDAAELAFYDQYVAWCQRRAESVQMPLHFAMQMPLRLASACLPAARAAVLGAADGWTPRDEDDPDAPPAGGGPTVPPHDELLAAARNLPDNTDSKFDQLLPIVRGFVEQGKRTLLFTFSKPTLAYLHRRLAPYARVAVLNGDVPREERRRVMVAFRSGEYDVLLANRVASEGLDFEFCSSVINYDLPWNPMEVEQRIGRIDRIGQREEKILVVNFYNEATLDEKILTRVLDRIGVFERAIGALEPIIQSHIRQIQDAAYDFRLTRAEREAKANQAITAMEGKRAEAERLAGAASDLLLTNDVDVSGLEQELVRGGRYVGQRELANLVHDWATTAGAPGVAAADGSRVRLRGNATMSEQLHGVVRRGDRMQAEVVELSRALRDETDVILVLDQEDARIAGGALLTATHPLVLAAVSVPGHRQARFATVRVDDPDSIAPPGSYAVVLTRVDGSGDRPTRELWAAAVDLDGRAAPSTVADALLAALARGDLRTVENPVSADALSMPVARAVEQIDERHGREELRRIEEAEAMVDTRRLRLREQLDRQLAVNERRLQTVRANGRGGQHLFEAMKRRAQERHRDSVRSLELTGPPDLRLEHIAVCYLEIAR